ncbi:MAG: LPS export ABC transporter periplasmic protein LptC [Gammaproteobacteria bacterium]|nr:LPS export ABC transporter periplasmic protein LptC [Gammaproteobacteria bacterium]
MINRGAFFGIFLISFLVIMTSWYAAKLSIIVPFSGATLTNMGTLKGGVIVQMNDQGKVEYKGTVGQATQNSDLDIALTDLHLVDYSSPLAWTLTASSGMLTDHNNILELEGGVNLSRPAASTSPAILLQTNRAKINVAAQFITGEDLITVTQPGTINLIQGIGFKAKIASRQVQLLSEVKSVYKPPAH